MYILEGNIGAGKSTFLRLIAQHLPYIQVVLEPLATWQHPIQGEAILSNFCQNPQRWAYSFETLTMMCRVKDHLAQQREANPLRILERSIYSGHYCFAINGFDQQFMSALEWEMYNQWFNFLIPNKCKPPFGFIYLRTEPKIAFERIKKRGRIEEESFPYTYLEQIHQRHEALLINKEHVLENLKNIPVLVLDCNQEFEKNPSILNNHFDQVKNFISQTLTPELAHYLPQHEYLHDFKYDNA